MHTDRSPSHLQDNFVEDQAIDLGPSSSSSTTAPGKLRLCFISNPNLVHTRRWVSWFAHHGHSVCLLADVPLSEPWTEVPVIDLAQIFYAKYIRFPVWIAWVRGFIRQWHPDILHAHRINSAGWMGAASGFHPYVVTPWGLDIFEQPQRSWVARQLAVYTLRHADLVTTISEPMANLAIKLGARQDHLRRVQFGVELDIFTPGSSTSIESLNLRRRLSLPDNARIVFSPRAVAPIYNLDIILESIPIVRKHIPETVFLFVDYNSDLGYKKKLEDISKALGIMDCVRWLPSTRSRHQMADYYRLSEIVVSVPSTDGGTPISVMEAMACGKPVVCTDLPQLREFISAGENGYLVPVGDVEPLAEAIIHLLQQPEIVAEFGRRARDVVAIKANRELEMQEMESLYYQLAEARR